MRLPFDNSPDNFVRCGEFHAKRRIIKINYVPLSFSDKKPKLRPKRNRENRPVN